MAMCDSKMLCSLSQLIASFSSNLNTCIVRLEELDSDGSGMSVAIDDCGRTALDSLAQRTDEILGVFVQIDVADALLQMVERDFVDAHRERFRDVLSLYDANVRKLLRLRNELRGSAKSVFSKFNSFAIGKAHKRQMAPHSGMRARGGGVQGSAG